MMGLVSSKRRFCIFAVFAAVALPAAAWPPPKIPREQIPDDMPADMRRHIEVLYDHAPNNAMCVAALRAIAAMGADAAPAVPFIAAALDRPSCDSNEEAAATLIKIGMAMEDRTIVIEPTIVAFSTGSRHGRPRALRVLRALGARQVVPALVAAMADGIGVRDGDRALQELGGYDYIEKSLAHDSPEVRQLAVRALAAMPSAWSARHLRAALSDPDDRARGLAVQGLAQLNNRGTAVTVGLEDSMFDSLKSPDPATRRYAVQLIVRSGGEAAKKIEALVPLITDSDDSVQLAVVDALGWIGGAEVVTALGSYVAHPYELARAAVARALGRTKQSSAVPLLETLLADSSSLVRENAIAALAALQGGAFGERMAQMLESDDDPLVLRTLLKLLGDLPDARHLGDLSRFLQHDDETVRVAAVETAAALGVKGQPTLLAALRNDSARVRQYAATKLRRAFRPTDGDVAQLLTLVNHPDPKTRADVFALLAHRDCKVSDLNPIRAALDDSSYDVRASAISILDRHKDYSRVNDIRPLVRVGHRGVAGAAIDMMFNAGDVDGVLVGQNHYDRNVRNRARKYLSRMDREKVRQAQARAATPRSVPAVAARVPATPVRSPRRPPVPSELPPETPAALAARLRYMYRLPGDQTADKLVAMGADAVDPVAALVDHKSPALRAAAVAVLGRIGTPAAFVAVARALSDADAGVRECATTALGRAGGSDATHALTQAMRSSDWHLRASAVQGLGRL